MSTETTKAWVHTPRIASFTVSKDKAGKRVFTAVNDRAKKIAVKAGKRKYVTAADLKPFAGYYKLRQYTNDGLKRIKV